MNIKENTLEKSLSNFEACLIQVASQFHFFPPRETRVTRARELVIDIFHFARSLFKTVQHVVL